MLGRTDPWTTRLAAATSRVHRRFGCVNLLGISADVCDAEDRDGSCCTMGARDALEASDDDAL